MQLGCYVGLLCWKQSSTDSAVKHLPIKMHNVVENSVSLRREPELLALPLAPPESSRILCILMAMFSRVLGAWSSYMHLISALTQ